MKDATDNKTSSLNDFQMEWNRRCMEENERVRQNPPSLEYLKAQSKRLAEQVNVAKMKEREERKLKKKRS